jgi:hypothetical protein
MLPVQIDSALGESDWGTIADPSLSVRHQVRLASQLHAVTGGGRLDLCAADPVADRATALRLAAESSVSRLRFRPPQ